MRDRTCCGRVRWLRCSFSLCFWTRALSLFFYWTRWLMLQGCLTSSAVSWHARIFTDATECVVSGDLCLIVHCFSDGIKSLPQLSSVAIWRMSLVPQRWRTSAAYGSVPVLGFFSKTFVRPSWKKRRPLNWSYFTSSDARFPVQFTQWGRMEHSSSLCPLSHQCPHPRLDAHLCWVYPNFWH